MIFEPESYSIGNLIIKASNYILLILTITLVILELRNQKNMKNLTLFTILILFSCEVSNSPSNSSSSINKTTLSLLDRLRSIPGLRIGGLVKEMHKYI